MADRNISEKKNPMPHLSAKERVQSFSEVALGYTAEQAISEAQRCLNCKNMPCVSGCPVGIRIPEFISHVREGDLAAAYATISATSCLPAVCGRVCPQETQCEAKCVRGIKGEPVAIGRLERFVADWYAENGEKTAENIEKNGIKVAIVGSGPAGLSCAGDLARLGYSVTVFEALHAVGGVLVYGIPEFRLPKSIVAREVERLSSLGVDFRTNVIIGKTLTVDDLFASDYRAVFIASGAGLPRFMGIAGEELCGVYSANEFLTRANLMKAYEKDSATPIMKGGRVAVVGGGNVAMDAARTALRLGAEKVYVVYRRSLDELPARREEVEHAVEEGVELMLLTNPTEILEGTRRGFVGGMRCVKMQLAEPDERDRRRPVELENSEFSIELDTVIMSIGTTPNPLISSTTAGLSVDSHGCIDTDGGTATSRAGVFAGGDAVTGAATVISAMGAGKSAARAIDEYIKTSIVRV